MLMSLMWPPQWVLAILEIIEVGHHRFLLGHHTKFSAAAEEQVRSCLVDVAEGLSCLLSRASTACLDWQRQQLQEMRMPPCPSCA